MINDKTTPIKNGVTPGLGEFILGSAPLDAATHVERPFGAGSEAETGNTFIENLRWLEDKVIAFEQPFAALKSFMALTQPSSLSSIDPSRAQQIISILVEQVRNVENDAAAITSAWEALDNGYTEERSS